ncbi:MAG: (Fe-S)-binding protein [Candidatus Methylumidiphilus sp.]
MSIDFAAATDLCVKCGLCLPHCPTYGKTQDESESPRGRLSLIQAWANGQLQATPKLLAHVDNCLLCRACEAACPANVPYGQIVDEFRAATAPANRPPFAAQVQAQAIAYTLQSPRLQRWTAPLRGALAQSGLFDALGLGDSAAGLPQAFRHAPWPGVHPAQGRETAHVALFLGCTAELADAETITAAIRLLNRLGVRVTVPKAQGCCGAMALHHGQSAQARQMQSRNSQAFGGAEFDAVLTIASGCGAVLKEYPNAATALNIQDISHFLAGHCWPEDAELAPLSARALLHAPCSLRNVLKSARAVAALLKRIPGLDVAELPQTINCCGAAGTYWLDHPDMAQALRGDIVQIAAARPPDYLLTSNVGCAMHLRAGLKRAGLAAVCVLHPVVLLERQLRR